MRVDNFSFLLEVERLTILEHYCLLKLILKVLLIAGAERFGIRVPHKLVGHTRLSSTSVAADCRVVHHECVLRLSHRRVAAVPSRSVRRKGDRIS